MPRFSIEYQTTQDNLNGSPWPPDGDDYWCAVARTNGSTRWRRIALANNSSPRCSAMD
jgi:hypothetical protein